MPTIHKKSCPTCGQSVNRRKITLTKEMVATLIRLYHWCGENRRHEFSRKDIKELIVGDVEIATFGNWIYFGGLFYRPQGEHHLKGHWGLNMKRAKAFIRGEHPINTVAWKDPLTGEVELSEKQYIYQVKGVSSHLDENYQFVAEYEDLESTSDHAGEFADQD